MHVITPKRTLITPGRVARSAGESEFPWTWNGLVRLWTPLRPHSKAIDYSPGRNHGTYNGGMASAITDPERGLVWDFDGTDDYVDMGGAVSIGGDTSVSIWFKLDSDQTGILTSQSGTEYVTAQYNSGGTLYVGRAASAQPFTFTYDTSWHHVVWTWNGSAIAAWFDGASKSLGGAAGINPGQTNFRIGSKNNTPSTFFNGQTQDARIYNRALSAAEVKQIYEGANPLTPRRRFWSILLAGASGPTYRITVIS